jgi:hypothetical protein
MNNELKLEQLRLAIHGVNAPFYIAGKYIPQEPITLRFKDRTTFVVERAVNNLQQVAELQPLINRCSPATFGDKRRNRLDRMIRDAMQLMAARSAFRVDNFDLEATGILDTIRRKMLPADSPSVTAELYSLNIYTTGGHFAPHKDTPRGKEMFGTLVVCLPSQFWRGQLTLTHRGVVQQFNWSEDIRNQKQATQLHWSAFFGDVDHQIERVGAGARVTLTYLLRRDGASIPSRTIADAELPSVIEQTWRESLADPKFMPAGGVVGYPCCHLYHQDARFQVKHESLDFQSANMLKGRDHLVAASALHAGLSVTFAPYLFENCVDETWQLNRFPTPQEKRKLGRQMDLSDLESALSIVGQSSEKVGDFGVEWLDPPPSSSHGIKADSNEGSEDMPVAGRLHSCEYCEWGYFGNEASDVDFYIYAALHVRIPKVGEGVRAGIGPKVRVQSKLAKSSEKTLPVEKKKRAAKGPSETEEKKTDRRSGKRSAKPTKRKRDA